MSFHTEQLVGAGWWPFSVSLIHLGVVDDGSAAAADGDQVLAGEQGDGAVLAVDSTPEPGSGPDTASRSAPWPPDHHTDEDQHRPHPLHPFDAHSSNRPVFRSK
jgi:hypothetical protein